MTRQGAAWMTEPQSKLEVQLSVHRRLAWSLRFAHRPQCIVNQWLNPAPSILLKSFLIALGLIMIGLLISVIQALITLPLYGHFIVFRGHHEASDLVTSADYFKFIFAAGLLAPVLETLIIIAAPYHLLARWVGLRAFLGFETFLALWLHYYLSPASLPHIATMFLCFGYQYDLWRQFRGWKAAFWGVALTHGVFNMSALAIAFVLGQVMSWFGV